MGDAKRQSDGKFGAGNTVGGRTPMSEEARKAFEDMEPEALKRLRDILNGPDDKLAIQAIERVFERRWGKAVQAVSLGSTDPDEPLSLTVNFVRPKK